MMSTLKHIKPSIRTKLRDMARYLGLEIRSNNSITREDLRLVHYLDSHSIDTVLDVGANEGQFAQLLFGAGYTGRIVSFEPLPDTHAQLRMTAGRFAPRWIVADPIALSDASGEATFFVTKSSTSSSLLKPRPSIAEAVDQLKLSCEIKVPTERLDVLVKSLGLENSHVLLKLDVQGAEDLVIRGAERYLSNVRGILVELSLVQMYEGQKLQGELNDTIISCGFELWDIWTGFRDPDTLRLNQIDGLYFRTRAFPHLGN